MRMKLWQNCVGFDKRKSTSIHLPISGYEQKRSTFSELFRYIFLNNLLFIIISLTKK